MESIVFSFRKNIYKQTYGLAMGSLLSSIIANMVLHDIEINILKELKDKISFYKRYVDDIILSAHPNDIEHIRNKFNAIHPLLQLAIETEENKQLNFLDMTISRNIDFATNWFTKVTHSGRYKKISSQLPTKNTKQA